MCTNRQLSQLSLTPPPPTPSGKGRDAVKSLRVKSPRQHACRRNSHCLCAWPFRVACPPPRDLRADGNLNCVVLMVSWCAAGDVPHKKVMFSFAVQYFSVLFQCPYNLVGFLHRDTISSLGFLRALSRPGCLLRVARGVGVRFLANSTVLLFFWPKAFLLVLSQQNSPVSFCPTEQSCWLLANRKFLLVHGQKSSPVGFWPIEQSCWFLAKRTVLLVFGPDSPGDSLPIKQSCFGLNFIVLN